MRILIHLMFILIISCNFTGINQYAFRRIHTVQPLTLQNVDTVCCGSDILDRKWYMVQSWGLGAKPYGRIQVNKLFSQNGGTYPSVDLFPIEEKNYFLLRSNGLFEVIYFDEIGREKHHIKGVFQIMGCQLFEFWEENKDDKSSTDDTKIYLYCKGSDLFKYTFISRGYVNIDLYTSLTNLKKSEENILTNKNYVYENFRQFLKQHYPYDYQLVTIEYGNGKEKVTILDER